jgi:hypothetical protein
MKNLRTKRFNNLPKDTRLINQSWEADPDLSNSKPSAVLHHGFPQFNLNKSLRTICFTSELKQIPSVLKKSMGEGCVCKLHLGKEV